MIKNIRLSTSTVKRYRGVISNIKDSFGFIERQDVPREIFFHITEFRPNVATNAIQAGVKVEFDIHDRRVSIKRRSYQYKKICRVLSIRTMNFSSLVSSIH